MSNFPRYKKLIAGILVASFIITAAVYQVYGTNKSQSSSEKSAGSTSNDQNKKVEEYESAIFKKDSVIDIKVEIADKDWESILADPMAEEYKSAKVTVNGVTVENVGFRTKGNLTLRSVVNTNTDRFSFKIKLNEYVDGQNILGLDEFVVTNMYADPSYLREYLSYEALREIGADVPDAVFANVYVNGKLQGFYLCVESIDDSFLKTNFGNNDGNLYRQDQGSTLQYSEGGNYDKSTQQNGDDESKTDLKNFIKTLNEMPEGQKGNIESVLDVDSALRYIAANTVLGNYDSYSGNMAQNYYLYGQNGKFTVIPWDYNMSLAGFSMGGGDATTIPIDEPVSGVNIKNLPLIDNLLAVEEYKNKYHDYVKQLLSYLEKFEGRVTEVSNIIRPYVQADPSKFYTIEQFEANIKYSETSTTSTSNIQQNANQGQIPQGNQRGFSNNNGQQPPQGDFNNGNGQQPPPQGDFKSNNGQQLPQGGMGGNMRGGRNGGGPGMDGNVISIVNFVRDRVSNINKQLSGELPTTGNTTMNNNNMRGGNRPQ